MNRFIQGDGYPIIYVFEGLTEGSSFKMPFVRDNGNNSYINQSFIAYPDENIRQHKLLSGSTEEDPPVGHNVIIQIKYSSIKASDLNVIFNKIIEAKSDSNKILKLKPRHNYDSIYSVVYQGDYPLESENMWRHSILLKFVTSTIINLPPFFSPIANVAQ